uniref:ATP synthase F0 subunit 8 n=1 Tax=Bactrocera moluccensis TaxID=2594017 RepID=UPI0023AB39E6|nr:ATP synthase F0 subunit 8 [Bactrocera moluccensis]WCB99038.1 ATP synthase F0 subunit 8 [Bactrocera moluccensis]
MPQMAPIGWLSLFTIFSITFILFSMMNYYSMTPKILKSKISNNHSTTSLNWKW